MWRAGWLAGGPLVWVLLTQLLSPPVPGATQALTRAPRSDPQAAASLWTARPSPLHPETPSAWWPLS